MRILQIIIITLGVCGFILTIAITEIRAGVVTTVTVEPNACNSCLEVCNKLNK